MEPNDLRRTYTPHEVSKFWRVSPNTVRAAIRRGEIPAVKIGRQYRIDAAYVDGHTGATVKAAS